MGSSEVLDSGKIAGHKSSFSQTCSLLSQYLKEKGSFVDLKLGFDCNSEPIGAPTKTMNLLPMIEKTSQIPEVQQPKPKPEKSKLTIFYAGQVLVFNDFPADKAEEIMLLASRGSSLKSKSVTTSNSLVPNPQFESANHGVVAPAKSVVPNFGINLGQENNTHGSLSTQINDLPIARKASLTRFLEKRKDRITTRAPYQISNQGMEKSKSAAEEKAWLGLAAQFPLQMDRHT